MRAGVRVIRGPDWDYGDVDGGEGGLGTIVTFEDVTVVEWDTGAVTECSAGRDGKDDLRLYDNAQIGECTTLS